MDVRASVLDSLREYRMLRGTDRVICALSGGADSVCLADVMLSLASELGISVECAHFNHLLRGEESRRDEEFVLNWCSERGLECHLGRGDAAAFAAEHGLGIEEAARTLRYAFFDSLGEEKTKIATAHQADDQAETMLLNLIRGSGLKGLGGIPPVRGNVIRPLLTVPREEILTYLRERQLRFVEDSSNQDTSFRRNRLRREVLPLLRQMNPAFAAACVRTARLLREDEALLSGMAEKAVAREGENALLSVPELRSMPAPLAARALRRAAGIFGVQPEETHITSLMAMTMSDNPSAKIMLPGGVIAQREYDRLLIGRPSKPESIPETVLPYGSWTEISEGNMLVFWGEPQELLKIHGKFTTFFFKNSGICGSIAVRSRREGDTLHLPGRPGKRLKKWMIQEKIPAARRESLPVFADREGVLAVPGLGADARAVSRPEEADSVLVIVERT